MRIEWSVHARIDRDEIFDYIEADSPKAAIGVDDAIRHHVFQLIDHPLSGRPGRAPDTRELVVTGLPYIVTYRVFKESVLILRVLHAARQWPDDLPTRTPGKPSRASKKQ